LKYIDKRELARPLTKANFLKRLKNKGVKLYQAKLIGA
jgi:hypothetical protein